MIKHAAIKQNNVVYVGYRHDRCLRLMFELNIDHFGSVQGFVNDKGEFLDRHEAAKEALDSGQISRINWPAFGLFSEDLY